MTFEKIGYKTKDNILVNYSQNKKVYYFRFEKDKTKTILIIDWKNKKISKSNRVNCKYEKIGIDEIYAMGEILRATRRIYDAFIGVEQ